MKDATPKAIYLKDYLPPAFLITTTDLVVELNDDVTIVTSSLMIERNPDPKADKTKDLVLNGGKLSLISVSIDDKLLESRSFVADENGLTVNNVPESFTLTTVVEIKPQDNTTLEGLYRSHSMYCTQCEAEGFRNITYYLDRPDVMSEFTTKIIADKKKFPVLLANGNSIGEGDLDNGRHWRQWHDPFKKPCYLFAMVAGNLSKIDDKFTTQSGREVTLQIFVEPKDLDKCDHAMTSLKNSMKWDEEVYGREYDLDIFMIVAVDDFNMGAMENKGLNIFNTSCVLAKPEVTTDAAFQRVEAVVAHEYFHNWSGNRVTCRDWFQLSLKEGFTVFRDSQFSSDMGSPTVKRVEDVSILRTMQFAEDAGPMSHPVQPSSFIEISNFYTLTIYEKGAEVVRMIHNLLGPELFRKGSDLYFDRHDGQAVTINEFTDAMEFVSGRDLTQFKHWYTQAGTPIIAVTDQYDAKNKTYTLTVKQSCPSTPKQPASEKLPYHIPLAMGLIGQEGELTASLGNNAEKSIANHFVLEVTQPEQSFVFTDVQEKPVPSLLRDFSAPVRLRYDYSRENLLQLIRLEQDGFSRWDACQSLGVKLIREMMAVNDISKATTDMDFIAALREILLDESLDPAMVALMLSLPTEAYLSELSDVVDIDGIHSAREKIRFDIATQLADLLESVYERFNSNEKYQATAEQIARRSLKNTALQYLSMLSSHGDAHKYVEKAITQYKTANNMTDTLGALRAIVNSKNDTAIKYADEALSDFYECFKDEPLAIDQWLMLQATSNNNVESTSLEKVKALMTHPCFSLKNPNKVRSLIGAFCNGNLVSFHAEDGSGYQFLGEQVKALNAINPQIASRLVTPLTRWKKYDEKRQQLMRKELEVIKADPALSKDVFEVVSKSLQQEN
ncbi:MAG: aminopeptidase N [Cellvibrionaceae bacterium]